MRKLFLLSFVVATILWFYVTVWLVPPIEEIPKLVVRVVSFILGFTWGNIIHKKVWRTEQK